MHGGRSAAPARHVLAVVVDAALVRLVSAQHSIPKTASFPTHKAMRIGTTIYAYGAGTVKNMSSCVVRVSNGTAMMAPSIAAASHRPARAASPEPAWARWRAATSARAASARLRVRPTTFSCKKWKPILSSCANVKKRSAKTTAYTTAKSRAAPFNPSEIGSKRLPSMSRYDEHYSEQHRERVE